ncbi:MAG: hypothetical protein PHQ46_06540 [Negativicutes bacterium]|nr:hypothetical protein [Negativicutes bacterium]
MENMQKAVQLNNNFWFSFFSQGFYFSFGYFAFPKIEYEADFLGNFVMTGLI